MALDSLGAALGSLLGPRMQAARAEMNRGGPSEDGYAEEPEEQLTEEEHRRRLDLDIRPLFVKEYEGGGELVSV